MQRRRFLQVGVATAAVATGACSSGSDAPSSFGDDGVDIESADVLRDLVDDGGGVHYMPSVRAYFVDVAPEHHAALLDSWSERLRVGLDLGLLALVDKCPHQGCRVPHCDTSGWFECPCHGSRFTTVGERRRGPSTRGMSAYEIALQNGRVLLRGDVIKGLDGDVDLTDAPEPDDFCTGG